MLADLLEKIKYQIKMLKHRPRLFWHKLYIRADEFHKSLDLDVAAMADMNIKDRKLYLRNLSRLRHIAHVRSASSKMFND